jgi:outer membrane protein, heavy metal efflux system
MNRVAVFLGLFALSASTTAAFAQETRVSFEDAVQAAGRSPRVRRDRQAAATLRRAADASPALDYDPMLNLAGGARLTPGGEQGFEGSVGVSQSLNLQGVVRLRREALGAEALWMGAEADAETLTRRLAAASAWLALRDAEEQLALAAQDIANESRFLALVTRLAGGGERTAGDVAAATLRLEESRLRGRMAEGELVDARARVAAEVGAPEPGAVLVTDGPVPEVTVPTAREQEAALAAAALPAVRARSLLARAEATRALEDRAMRGTRMTVGLELRRDALGATVAQANVAIPIPVFDVGAREYAARQASAARLEGEAADEQVRARVALTLAAHEVEHAGEVYAALRSSLVPSGARAVALRERELAAGEATTLDVLDARRSLNDATSRLVRATRDRAWARIRLVALLGSLGGAR